MIAADKTITCSVISCTNALTGEYKLKYQGGEITAYTSGDETYNANATVYVLVPQGDFTKRKQIISKAQALEGDDNITFVSSALSDYNIIGGNVLSEDNDDPCYPVELNSYLKEDYVLLYKHDLGDLPQGEEYHGLNIDEEQFLNNLKEAEALMIEASFYTRLPKQHRKTTTGDYGLTFNLAFKDKNGEVDENGDPAVKVYSYPIDVNSMTGNPYSQPAWSEQYGIYDIDVENFLYIDSILAYCKDFVDKDEYLNQTVTPDDIFIKDLEIYGLKAITAVNGEYRLSLSMPQGSTFRSIREDDKRSVVGKMTKSSVDISDGAMFYWFAQDNRVDSSSEDYHMYGGAGWRYLEAKGNFKTLSLSGKDNRSYENRYLCVAVYKQTMILKEEFVIYNEAAKRDISIQSSLGVKFSFDRGKPTLTCLIDGKAENFEEGVNAHPDFLFRFIWSKVNLDGTTLIFNQTKEQLQEQYDQALKEGAGYAALTSIKNLITQMDGVEFEIGKNKLIYPVKQIDSSATFVCSVYLMDTEDGQEYCIGQTQITLQNEDAATPTDYYIIIENGNQVFQYSESGVAPDNERYDEPIEVRSLICHFYDPNGLEVNDSTYTVKWRFPTSSTLIETPAEGVMVNPANDKIEWCISEVYPLAIKDTYNYDALDNQVEAIVEYQGQEYTKETDLFFTKVGENGTNGTDIVAKISPNTDNVFLDDNLLSMVTRDDLVEEFDNGTSTRKMYWNVDDFSNFSFYLFNRNVELEIEDDKVQWGLAGISNLSSRSKYITDVSNGIITWNESGAEDRMFREQILKASYSITEDGERHDYYAFYPVPIINYMSQTYEDSLNLQIDSDYTLRTITYNADGRNPLYNKNQGVKIKLPNISIDDDMLEYWNECNHFKNLLEETDFTSFTADNWVFKLRNIISFEGSDKISETQNSLSDIWNNSDLNLEEKISKSESEVIDFAAYIETFDSSYRSLPYIVWKAEGGKPDGDEDNPSHAAFDLSYEKDSNDKDDILLPRQYGDVYEFLSMIYVIPDDVYSGEYCNNLVHCEIYSDKTSYDNNGYPLAQAWIPIHMSLNTYGLASLNAWDGNHVEINEDDNYILAPQIGAGEKNEENQFTGILMGTQETYDKMDETGQSVEKQIGLFGYAEGKQSIFLDASTGNASFGLPENQADSNNRYTEGRIELVPGGESHIGRWVIGTKSLFNMTPEAIKIDGYEEPAEDEIQIPGDRYTGDYEVADSEISVPYNAQGILFNSEPAYMSIKGKPLNSSNSDIDWGGANTVLKENDSLEVELDPGKSSIFSIYRHTCYDGADIQYKTDEDGNKVPIWHRYPLVGINANGQFYTNAVEDGESSMGIGSIGAFHDGASNQKYVGAQFAWSGANLFKFYIDSQSVETGEYTKENAPLNISTGTQVDYWSDGKLSKGNEYPRAINIYGKSLSLNTPNINNQNDPLSNHRISISRDELFLGHDGDGTNSYIRFPMNATDVRSEIKIDTDLDFSVNKSNNREMKLSAGSFSLESGPTDNSTSYFNLDSDLSLEVSDTGNICFGKDFEVDSQYFLIHSKFAPVPNYKDPNDSVASGTQSDVNPSQTDEPETYEFCIASNNQSMGLTNKSGAYIRLHPTVYKSMLHADQGWNITSDTGGIYVNSKASAQGIVLQATPAIGDSANGVRLSMIPKMDGNSDFALTCPHGTIRTYQKLYSVKNANGTTSSYSGIALTKAVQIGNEGAGAGNGLMVNGGLQKITEGSTGGNTYWYPSIDAQYGIRSGQRMQASAFYFSSDRTYKYNGKTYNNRSVSSQLNSIYTILGNLRTRIDNEINNRKSAVDNLEDSLKDWVDDLYLPRAVFNTHRHRVNSTSTDYRALTTWDTYSSAVGDVSHIKQTKSLSDLNTSAPNR